MFELQVVVLLYGSLSSLRMDYLKGHKQRQIGVPNELIAFSCLTIVTFPSSSVHHTTSFRNVIKYGSLTFQHDLEKEIEQQCKYEWTDASQIMGEVIFISTVLNDNSFHHFAFFLCKLLLQLCGVLDFKVLFTVAFVLFSVNIYAICLAGRV